MSLMTLSKAMTRCMRDLGTNRRRSARQFADRAGHRDRVRRVPARPGAHARRGQRRARRVAQRRPRGDPRAGVDGHGRVAPSGGHHHPAPRMECLRPQADSLATESGDRAAQLVSLSELRRGFEPAAAALAARRADPHQCRIMAAAVSDMVVHGRSGDLEAYLLADKIFHRTLLEASGNEMFRALNGVVAEVLTGRTHHGMMPACPTRRPSNCTTRSPGLSGWGTRPPPNAPCGPSSTRRHRLSPRSFRTS